MKSCRQTASISAKDTEGGDDTGLTVHIEPYCGEDWPVSTNVYNSQMLMAMQNITSDRVGLMKDPPPHTHLGELLRESMEDTGWSRNGDGNEAWM